MRKVTLRSPLDVTYFNTSLRWSCSRWGSTRLSLGNEKCVRPRQGNCVRHLKLPNLLPQSHIADLKPDQRKGDQAMPKTFPIRLEVEEIALGPVLRKLNDMPGIVDLHLDLGHGGQGAGRKQLEHSAAERRSGGNNQQTIVKLLLDGAKHINEITRAIGGKKSSAYTATSMMRKQGLIEAGVEKGMHQLTAKARAQLGGAMPALPAPEVKHGPAGRAAPGSGNIVLRSALEAGPVSPSDLRAHLGSKGMSPKSVSGVIDRAKKHGLIKKNGSGYELTAKGQKIETGVAANG